MLGIQVQTLPPGDAGTLKTLDIMGRFVKQGIESDARVHRIAQSIAATSPDHMTRLRAVYDWLRRVFVFKHDTRGYEQIRTIPSMLDQFEAQGRIAGDCDDLSIMGAALIQALGYGTGFTVVAASPRGRYAHVYPTAFLGKLAIPLDPQEGTPFGQNTIGARRISHYVLRT